MKVSNSSESVFETIEYFKLYIVSGVILFLSLTVNCSGMPVLTLCSWFGLAMQIHSIEGSLLISIIEFVIRDDVHFRHG